MQVRMLTTMAGPRGTYHANELAVFEDDLARELVAGAYAVAVDPAAAAPVRDAGETTEAPAVETPERRRPNGRRG